MTLKSIFWPKKVFSFDRNCGFKNVLMIWWSICHWCLQSKPGSQRSAEGWMLLVFRDSASSSRAMRCIVGRQSWHHSLWAERPKFKHAKKQSAAVCPGASDLKTSVNAASGRLFSNGHSQKFEEKWTTFEMLNGMTKGRKHFESSGTLWNWFRSEINGPMP